jgi:hypothetical protein
MSADDLQALIERTRALVGDLAVARQDVLSVADLNRSIQQILRNQLAILESLTARPVDQNAATTAQRRPLVEKGTDQPAAEDGWSFEPQISLRPKDPNERPESGFEPIPIDDERDDPRQRDVSKVTRIETGELNEILEDLGAEAGSLAESVLDESRELPPTLARGFVERFDNRDKIYEKGLEKLNRWVAGGTTGTPFQWRGDAAYLNLNGAAPAGIRKYEEQLMKRMGFSRRLGRLAVPQLDGEVVVYERP